MTDLDDLSQQIRTMSRRSLLYKTLKRELSNRGYWKNLPRGKSNLDKVSKHTVTDTGKTLNGKKVYSSPDIPPGMLYGMTGDFVEKRPRRSSTLTDMDKENEKN